MKIKDELNKLGESDIYSLILFALYKIKDIPEYSTLSELAFIIDKESLLRLCEYFGGLTIKIPTIDDIESLVYSLLLYQHVDIEGLDFEESVETIGKRSSDMRKIKSNYMELKEILEKYEFGKRKRIRG